MKQLQTTGGEAQGNKQTDSTSATVQGLDAQYAELIEAVWEYERDWALDDRVAAIKYGR